MHVGNCELQQLPKSAGSGLACKWLGSRCMCPSAYHRWVHQGLVGLHLICCQVQILAVLTVGTEATHMQVMAQLHSMHSVIYMHALQRT